jgi:hypothetical protein
MIGAGGDLGVFWSNGLVGTITTLASPAVLAGARQPVRERRQAVAAGKQVVLKHLSTPG